MTWYHVSYDIYTQGRIQESLRESVNNIRDGLDSNFSNILTSQTITRYCDFVIRVIPTVESTLYIESSYDNIDEIAKCLYYIFEDITTDLQKSNFDLDLDICKISLPPEARRMRLGIVTPINL